MKMHCLTVNLYINAWLDCSNPFISIHSKHDDTLLAHFNSRELSELLKDGDISVDDLKSTNTKHQVEIVSILLAKKTKDKVKEQIQVMHFNKRDKANKVRPILPNLTHNFVLHGV